MVSRSEIDLFNIRKDFKETHDATLHEFIQVEALVVSGVLLVYVPVYMRVVQILCFVLGVAHPLLVRSRGTECLTGSCGVLARLSCLGISPACLTSSQCAESDWWRKAKTGSV